MDPSTFTYVSEPNWREWFRGSAAHNTIRVNRNNQARTAGPFRWEAKPAVHVLAWITCARMDYLDAECVTEFRHRRRYFLSSQIWF
jgi:hypothetical protein